MPDHLHIFSVPGPRSLPTAMQRMEAIRHECECPICHDLLVEAIKCPCCRKNAYCKFCLEQWVACNPAGSCPICRSSIPDPLPAPDVATNRKVASLFKEESKSRRLEVKASRARWFMEKQKKAGDMGGNERNGIGFFLTALIPHHAPVDALFELVG